MQLIGTMALWINHHGQYCCYATNTSTHILGWKTSLLKKHWWCLGSMEKMKWYNEHKEPIRTNQRYGRLGSIRTITERYWNPELILNLSSFCLAGLMGQKTSKIGIQPANNGLFELFSQSYFEEKMERSPTIGWHFQRFFWNVLSLFRVMIKHLDQYCFRELKTSINLGEL